MTSSVRAIISLSCLFFPSLIWGGEAPLKVRVAYGTITSGYSVVWIAKDAGIFAQNGLDVELLLIQSSPILAAAMVSGNVPLAVMGGAAAVASNLSGSDLVLIGSLRKISSLAFFVTTKDISRPEQLKGKILGIDRFGGAGDFILRLVLEKLGLNPEKDVTIRQVGQSPVRLAALQAGVIHGTTLSAEDKVAADRIGLPVLVDVRKLGVEILGSDLVATRNFIKAEETTVRRFMKALVEGIRYYKSHRVETMQTMARYMKVKDPALIEAGYDFNAQEYQRKPYPSIGGIQTALEQMSQTIAKAKNANVERFFDARFVRELDQSGFIDTLYK
jgi:ABC-type nitrate/sulfonate/bicarbonate transport system substrate-binding protein